MPEIKLTHELSYDQCQQWNASATLWMPDDENEVLFIQESIGDERVWVDATDVVVEGQWVWRDGKRENCPVSTMIRTCTFYLRSYTLWLSYLYCSHLLKETDFPSQSTCI